LLESLSALGDELRFVLITSAATLMPLSAADADAVSTETTDLKLKITVVPDEKCERCWHRSPDVGQSEVHSALCSRCIENIDGNGERRQYA
jgi:isoleucyl-tRNA synthetase